MILEKIKKKIIPLDEFINLCLYQYKDSYYQKKINFGYRGDFVTSPHISSIFSEMLAIWIITFWSKINKPNKLNILELGPGDGTMAYDILDCLKKIKSFNAEVNYYLLETSVNLTIVQKKKLQKYQNIHWIKNLTNFKKKNLIIISNEFFDALPIKQVIKKNNIWYEKYVFFNNKKKIIQIQLVKANKFLMSKIKEIYDLNKNTLIEFPTCLNSVIKKLSCSLKMENSIFITIDYGENSEICNDTLQAIHRNKKSNFLKNIGDSDITYQVNFYHLIKLFEKNKLHVNNFLNQSQFLQSLGIKERLIQATKNLPKKQKAQHEKSVKRLIHPLHMGDLFKVLIVSNKNNKSL